jgi:uncharacterized protein (TIGR00369 family)
MREDREGSLRLRKSSGKDGRKRTGGAKASARSSAKGGGTKAAAAESHERELLRRFHSSRSTRTFGFRLKQIRRGRVSLEMDVARRFLQAHGRLHGGVIATLADTAAAFAAYTAVPPGSRLVTLEMKINFLEGVDSGVIAARGRVIRLGKNVAVTESDVRDGAGRLVAKALVTIAVAEPKESSR